MPDPEYVGLILRDDVRCPADTWDLVAVIGPDSLTSVTARATRLARKHRAAVGVVLNAVRVIRPCLHEPIESKCAACGETVEPETSAALRLNLAGRLAERLHRNPHD